MSAALLLALLSPRQQQAPSAWDISLFFWLRGILGIIAFISNSLSFDLSYLKYKYN